MSADIPMSFEILFLQSIEGEMIFEIAEVAPRHLMTSTLYLTSEPRQAQSVLRVKNIILKRNWYSLQRGRQYLAEANYILLRSLYTF